MDPVAAPLAVTIGVMGAVIGNVVEALSGGDSTPTTASLTQLGVTGACILIAWWMLRRSDQRERNTQDEVAKARQAAFKQLEMRADSERKRADAAEDRAALLADRLVKMQHDEHPEQM